MLIAQSISRRKFIAGGLATGLMSTPSNLFFPANAYAAGFPGVSFPQIVDCSVRASGEAKALADAGVRVVMRYYARQVQSGFEDKSLTPEEAKAILDAKMAIGLTYQFYNQHIACFSESEAQLAAKHCLKQDKRLNPKTGVIEHPDGTAMYFGVDSDFPTKNPPDKKIASKCPPTGFEFRTEENDAIILKYFEIVGNVLSSGKSPFRVGVYGGGRFCRMLAKKGVTHFWLPGSTGWAGTPEFYNGVGNVPPWTLYQNAVEVPFGAIAIDTNIANPLAQSLGVFRREELVTKVDDKSVRQSLRFIQVKSAFLLEPRGDAERQRHPKFDDEGGFEMIDFIPQRKMVTMLAEPTNGFTKVGVTFTFRRDTAKGPQTGSEYGVQQIGYVENKALQDIAKMPN